MALAQGTRVYPILTHASNFHDNSYDYPQSPPPRQQHSPSEIRLIRTERLDPAVKSIPSKSVPWYQSPKAWLAALGILALVAAIVIATVLAVVLTRNPLVADTTSTTSTTTMPPINISGYWKMDNTVSDEYGTFDGALQNGATYSNITYFGYGMDLSLNSSSNQYAEVTSPFFNLSYTSFTLEAWINGWSYTGDKSIFGQCQCQLCRDQCLHMIIRGGKMYMGFGLDDLQGTLTLSPATGSALTQVKWYHVAFVYDYASLTQTVYLQGVPCGSRGSAGPYQGQSGPVRIGGSHLSSSSFNGLIDDVRLTTRAKSAAEVLNDATLVAYFSFDGPVLEQDMGPNQINSYLSNGAVVSGRVGRGLALSGSSTSYLQAFGFFQLGQPNQAFTFAMWINPSSTSGGALIHKTSYQNGSGGWIQTMMGLSNFNQISHFTNGGTSQITGPMVPVSQWTHVIYSYSQANGQTMYVNGAQIGRTGSMSFSSSSYINVIDWLTFGYNPGGGTQGPVAPIPFSGMIDEVYIYRREITASEAMALANP